MTESFPSAVQGRWRPGARFLFRVGRRTLVDSLYLLTAPVTAAAGLLLVLGGLCVATVGLLLPGGSPVPPGALALARWSADLERWRIAKVRSQAAVAEGAGQRPRPKEAAAASDPGLWLDMAHAVAVLPVVLVTSVVTGLWWFFGVASATFPLRNQDQLTSGSVRPETQTLYAGSIAVSLHLKSPTGHVAFAITLSLLVLVTLPLVTWACVAVQAGLGQALLSGESALHRRISGLEQERDTARA